MLEPQPESAAPKIAQAKRESSMLDAFFRTPEFDLIMTRPSISKSYKMLRKERAKCGTQPVRSCSVRIITLGRFMQHVIFQFICLVGRSPSDLHDLPVVTRATANLIGYSRAETSRRNI